MDIFRFRVEIVQVYAACPQSFIRMRDKHSAPVVQESTDYGAP